MPPAKPPAPLPVANAWRRLSFSPASSGRRQARCPKPSRNWSRQAASPLAAGSQGSRRAQLADGLLGQPLGRLQIALGQRAVQAAPLGAVVETELLLVGGKQLGRQAAAGAQQHLHGVVVFDAGQPAQRRGAGVDGAAAGRGAGAGPEPPPGPGPTGPGPELPGPLGPTGPPGCDGRAGCPRTRVARRRRCCRAAGQDQRGERRRGRRPDIPRIKLRMLFK